jgi:hypothetical protein
MSTMTMLSDSDDDEHPGLFAGYGGKGTGTHHTGQCVV